MSRKTLILTVTLFIITESCIFGCLITNCPRGGKRNGKFNMAENSIKPCLSCGPGRIGQCFGPNICCGPFGCLIGTTETIRCKHDGQFNDSEPCIAGNTSCRRHTGRCATEGICCNQESCHFDKSCSLNDKISRVPDGITSIDFYNLMNYQNQPEYVSDK